LANVIAKTYPTAARVTIQIWRIDLAEAGASSWPPPRGSRIDNHDKTKRATSLRPVRSGSSAAVAPANPLARKEINIILATREDGTELFTKRNARQFSSLGKKDFVSAWMYCYAGFLMWLKGEDWARRGRRTEGRDGR